MGKLVGIWPPCAARYALVLTRARAHSIARSNTLVILILLACVGATGRDPTDSEAITILHVQFAIALAIILGLLVYRFTKLEESKVWEAERRGVDQELEDEGSADKKWRLYTVILGRNWSRLFETSFAW